MSRGAEFYFGTLITAALTSAFLAVIYVIGGFIERATGGWGVNGYFFALDWLWAAGPLVAGLFYFALGMLFFTVGFVSATIYKRFGGLWLTIVLLGLGLVLVAAMWVVGRANAWAELFGWFASIGVGGLAGLVAVAVLACAVVAFPILRRATP